MPVNERDEWLQESQEYFREVQAYNTTIITVGYGTFFALLLFLQDKAPGRHLFLAGLLVAVSAAVFVAYELTAQIRLAWGLRKIGAEGQRFFRHWAAFFIPSLLLAIAGATILIVAFLGQLLSNVSQLG